MFKKLTQKLTKTAAPTQTKTSSPISSKKSLDQMNIDELSIAIEKELGAAVATALREEEIDGEAFMGMQDDDFKDIGIKKGSAVKLRKFRDSFASSDSAKIDVDVGNVSYPTFDPEPSREKVDIPSEHEIAETIVLNIDQEVVNKFQESKKPDVTPVEVPELKIVFPETPEPVERSNEDYKKQLEETLTMAGATKTILSLSKDSPQSKVVAEILSNMKDTRTYILSFYFTKNYFPPPSHLVKTFPLLTRTEAQDLVKSVMSELSKLENPKKFVIGDREYTTQGSYDDGKVRVRGHQRAEERSDPNRFERSDVNHFISTRDVLEHKPCWFDPAHNLRALSQADPNRESKVRKLYQDATDATKDPFDTVYFPRANFSGIERYDGDHGHINDNQVDPINKYAKMAMLQDDVVMTGEVVAMMPSDGGKFRTMLFNDDLNNNVMTLGHIDRVKYNLIEYTNDRKTLGIGMCSRNRRELCGTYDYKGLWNAHHSGIDNHAQLYYESLYSAVHQLMYHPKATFAMIGGSVEGPSAGLGMHAECRMGHAGARLSFNQCQRGSTLDCGSTWRLTNMGMGMIDDIDKDEGKKLKTLSYYLALTGRPMSMWDMMELNFCDWAWPHENGPYTMSQIGEQIDQKMRDLFWEQDKYHVRTNFKSIVELHDRGLEFFRSPLLAGEQGEQVANLMGNFMDNLMKSDANTMKERANKVVGALTGLQEVLKQESNNKEKGWEAGKMLEGLEKSSPMSLMCTTMLLMKCWKMQSQRGTQRSKGDAKAEVPSLMNDIVLKRVEDRTDPLATTFLKMEYRLICWLMQRGDFWEGVQAQVFPKNGPMKCGKNTNYQTDSLVSLGAFLKTPAGAELLEELDAVMQYPVDLKSQTEIPARNIPNRVYIPDLQLPHIPLRDTLVHPEFTLPGLTWKGTEHYNEQLRKQVIWNYDYSMLRGSAHPDMDLILQRRSPTWRRDIMEQGREAFKEFSSAEERRARSNFN